MGKAEYDPCYRDFFECFNQQRFFEAHEVLETLWLPQRQGPNGSFYKGLIQLAGAFVHCQKNRPGPAVALFDLARTNLRKYPAIHDGLDVKAVLTVINEWLRQLKPTDPMANPLLSANPPQLRLEGTGYEKRQRGDTD
jgi:predicted metal-dependent hydrolase